MDTPSNYINVLQVLERQIICATFSSGLCRWEWCRSGSSRSSGGIRSWERLCTLGGSLSGSGIYTVHLPGADIIKPTAIILMGINVKTDAQLFTDLNIHISYLVLTKHAEHALLRELFVSLNYIVLTFPRVACTGRNAALRGHHGDDFSFYFHCLYLFMFVFSLRN